MTTAPGNPIVGPGSSALNDFNEANMKIAFSTEFRFKLLGDPKVALFADAGNIWNDNVTDPKSTFTGLSSLKDIALGSGFDCDTI
jgi:outer membrane protein assembly factor BamA